MLEPVDINHDAYVRDLKSGKLDSYMGSHVWYQDGKLRAIFGSESELSKIIRILKTPGSDGGLVMLVDKNPEIIQTGMAYSIAVGDIRVE